MTFTDIVGKGRASRKWIVCPDVLFVTVNVDVDSESDVE